MAGFPCLLRRLTSEVEVNHKTVATMHHETSMAICSMIFTHGN